MENKKPSRCLPGSAPCKTSLVSIWDAHRALSQCKLQKRKGLLKVGALVSAYTQSFLGKELPLGSKLRESLHLRWRQNGIRTLPAQSVRGEAGPAKNQSQFPKSQPLQRLGMLGPKRAVKCKGSLGGGTEPCNWSKAKRNKTARDRSGKSEQDTDTGSRTSPHSPL